MKDNKYANQLAETIGGLVRDILVVIVLSLFILGLFAPAFSSVIERELQKRFVEYDDYEQRAADAMKTVRVLLWIICIVSWGLAVLGYRNYYNGG